MDMTNAHKGRSSVHLEQHLDGQEASSLMRSEAYTVQALESYQAGPRMHVGIEQPAS